MNLCGCWPLSAIRKLAATTTAWWIYWFCMPKWCVGRDISSWALKSAHRHFLRVGGCVFHICPQMSMFFGSKPVWSLLQARYLYSNWGAVLWTALGKCFKISSHSQILIIMQVRLETFDMCQSTKNPFDINGCNWLLNLRIWAVLVGV